MKVITIIILALFTLPALIAFSLMLTIPIVGLWWISLPIYYMLLGLEFWSIGRVERETGRIRGPILVLIAQVLLPFLPFALYQFMPFQTHANEQFSGNAYWAVSLGITIAVLGFVVFAVARETAMQNRNEEVEHRTPGRGEAPRL